jgi:hypothetical protein
MDLERIKHHLSIAYIYLLINFLINRMVLIPYINKIEKYFRIEHGRFDKIFDSKFDFFLFFNMYSKIKPLKIPLCICIRSHINIIMTIFNPGNYLKITHRKIRIKCNVWLKISNLIIKIVEYYAFFMFS